MLSKSAARPHRRVQPRFTKATVALILGVHRSSVSRWLADGALAGLEPADLCTFLRAHGWRGRLLAPNAASASGELTH